MRLTCIPMMCAALAVLGSTPAQAADALILEPTSAWSVDARPESCALRRSFGTPDKEVVLELDNFSMGNALQVSLIGTEIEAAKSYPATSFLPDDQVKEQTGAFYFALSGGRKGFFFFDRSGLQRHSSADAQGISAPETGAPHKREAEITGLLVSGAFQNEVILQTGAMSGPMDALRRCLANLAVSKGLNPKTLFNLSRLPSPKDPQKKLQKAFMQYPPELVRKNLSAPILVRALIDETGKAVSCEVKDVGQDKRFDKLVCGALMDVKSYDPALDADGKPVKAYYEALHVYRLH